jgi:hypothetical protein
MHCKRICQSIRRLSIRSPLTFLKTLPTITRATLFSASLLFGGMFFTHSVFAACSNPSPLPAGYAAPCPIFSVSPTSVSQTGTLTLSATPQPGTDYIYTTAYYAKGSTWLPITLTGKNAAPSYSTGIAFGAPACFYLEYPTSRHQLHRPMELALGCNRRVLQRPGTEPMQYRDVEGADVRAYRKSYAYTDHR